jgi:hypothetical protein
MPRDSPRRAPAAVRRAIGTDTGIATGVDIGLVLGLRHRSLPFQVVNVSLYRPTIAEERPRLSAWTQVHRGEMS